MKLSFPHWQGLENVLVVEPLPYGEFCRLMNDCDVLLTDSGGVQEEGPSLGKPVSCSGRQPSDPKASSWRVQLLGTDEGGSS